MSALPHASLLCPGCYRDFRVAAWRVLPGAEIGCPHCHQTMRFDISKPEHKHVIDCAKAATKRQRDRVDNLKTAFAPASGPHAAMPEELEEVIQRLRELLAQDVAPQRRRG